MIIIATQLQALKLEAILPSSIAEDPKILAVSEALDPEFTAITEAIKHTGLLYRLDDLDAKTLDLLAWQFHADFYDLTEPFSYASLRLKQEAVKNSLLFHMRKGTVAAIMEALRQLDIQADFIPWWQSGDDPYTFRIDAVVAGDFYKTSGKDILMKSIVRAVNEAKSARSYMSLLHVEINEQEGMNITAGALPFIEGIIPVRSMPPGDMSDTLKETIGILPFIEGIIPVRSMPPGNMSDTLKETVGILPFIEGIIPVRSQPHGDIEGTITAAAGALPQEEWKVRIRSDALGETQQSLPVNFGVPVYGEWDIRIRPSLPGENFPELNIHCGAVTVTGTDIRIKPSPPETESSNLSVNMAVTSGAFLKMNIPSQAPEVEGINIPVNFGVLSGSYGNAEIHSSYPEALNHDLCVNLNAAMFLEGRIRVRHELPDTDTGQAVLPVSLGLAVLGSAAVPSGYEDISASGTCSAGVLMAIFADFVIRSED